MIDNATFQLLMSGGFISGFIILIFKMRKIAQKIDSMGTDIQEMKQDLRSIDGRLNRLEGAF